jgi:hypothetical protein
MLSLRRRHDLDHLRHDLAPGVDPILYIGLCQFLGITVSLVKIRIDCYNYATLAPPLRSLARTG